MSIGLRDVNDVDSMAVAVRNEEVLERGTYPR